MNAFIRFKLALTEEKPIIKPYREEKWANLADSLTIEIDESLMLLIGLHKKWARLIKSLSLDQLEMDYEHPQHGLKFNLISTDRILQLLLVIFGSAGISPYQHGLEIICTFHSVVIE